MKQLVGLYCEKLSQTNFSNNNDFRSFLQSLCSTFKEFKMHEQIENEYIINLLQQRCCTVYNVHSDNKLSEMLSLFEKGLQNVKNEYEQLNYAQQLKERLEAFTQDFLPHMKEEEEVFQPMLMEYFSYEELKDIKKQVIAQHSSQQQWDSSAEVLKGLSLWSQAEELHKAFKYSDHEKADYVDRNAQAHISQLPTEIMLRLFRYLGPEDLCRCSQVCRSWSELAKTGSLWRHLYPVRWARGDYYNGPPADQDQEPDDDWVKSCQKEGLAYQERDEDADVDESDVSGQTDSYKAITNAQREKKLLNDLIHHLLPAVGGSVKSIVLAYSSTVSSKMVRQILNLCPNISLLDLTQTDVTDSAFDSWSFYGACHSLEHLDLSGCEKISDYTLKKLSEPPPGHEEASGVHLQAEERPVTGDGCSGLALCRIYTLSLYLRMCSAVTPPAAACLQQEYRTEHSKRSLRFLSLSGCYQVTDAGLRSLSQRGGLPVLEHLNLSGCLFITEVGLQELVSACPSLKDEHFYYCDNINGPLADTASGCQNLQCGFRACCRSGE
uniref:F-box/LRR-repeat protein 5 n=1 Tax=Knipowitschia caucasica TaxID=637954 RepID=A0AAV2KSM6_KNICA